MAIGKKSAIDLIKDLQSKSTRFSSPAQSVADFTSIQLPNNYEVKALRTMSRLIPGSMKNTRPFIIRAIVNDVNRSTLDDLVLLVNPADLRISGAKSISERFTRGGWVIDKWGDNLDRMSASGSTGAFYVPSTGITNRYRTDSAAYQGLYSLLIYYKMNGRVFIDSFDKLSRTMSVATSEQGQMNLQRIKSVGEIQIEYGPVIYIGSFSQFTINDRAEEPYRMFYSFEFDIRKTIFTGDSDASAPRREYVY